MQPFNSFFYKEKELKWKQTEKRTNITIAVLQMFLKWKPDGKRSRGAASSQPRKTPFFFFFFKWGQRKRQGWITASHGGPWQSAVRRGQLGINKSALLEEDLQQLQNMRRPQQRQAYLSHVKGEGFQSTRTKQRVRNNKIISIRFVWIDLILFSWATSCEKEISFSLIFTFYNKNVK